MFYFIYFLKAEEIKPNYIGLNFGKSFNTPSSITFDLFLGRNTSPLFDILLYIKNDYFNFGSSKVNQRIIFAPSFKWRFASQSNVHLFTYGGLNFMTIFQEDKYDTLMIGLHGSVGIEMYINNSCSMGFDFFNSFPFGKYKAEYLYTGKIGLFVTYQF
jgi:hypothetical protein